MLIALIVVGVVVGMFALGAVVLGIFSLFGGGHGGPGENHWDAGSSGGFDSFDGGGGSGCGGGGCGGGGGD